ELLVEDETNPSNDATLAAAKDLSLADFFKLYHPDAQQTLPLADPDGWYHLELDLLSTHARGLDGGLRPCVLVGSQTVCPLVCGGEHVWDHFQRVTVDNVTTGQSWSFDIHNDWPDANGQPEQFSCSDDVHR